MTAREQAPVDLAGVVRRVQAIAALDPLSAALTARNRRPDFGDHSTDEG